MTIKNKCTVIYEVAYSFSKGGAGSAACQVINILSKQGFTVKKIEAKGYQKEETLLEKSKYILISKIFSIVIMITGFMILGPIFGIIGLAITLLISTSVEAFYLILVNKFRERNNL